MSFDILNKYSRIYQSLDADIDSFFSLNLDIKQNLRAIASDLGEDEITRECAKLELDIFDLQLAIDDLNDFDINKLSIKKRKCHYVEYFIERTKTTTNSFLLARYNHILWLSKKHNTYATDAIKNYLLANEFSQNNKNKNNDWATNILECLKRSFLIKQKIKSNTFNIEQKIINAIILNLNDSWGFCICLRLLDVVLISYKTFKTYISEDFCQRIKEFACSLIETNAFQAISIMESLILIAEKMGYNTTNMYETLGVANEKRISELKKSFASVSFCLTAIEIYNKLHNNTKVEELKKIYEDITKNMKFGTFSTSINIEPLIYETQNQITQLNTLTVEEVIQTLITSKLFIPSKDYIIEQAKRNKEQSMFYFLTGKNNIFDQRGNLVKVYSSENEILEHESMQTYRFCMEFKSIKIDMVLSALFTTGKISYDSIIKYLMEKSWLSHTFEINLVGGTTIKYTYLNIVKTLLNEYFKIVNNYLSSKNIGNTGLMMFVDSFALKFEGLIRELFFLQGFPTIIQNYETNTVMEKDINALLHDENIKTILDPDELLFYKYLFIEQEGINLRNRVAHSLFLEQEYDVGLAHLLFIALLRLFKFQITNTVP